jgi:hypothetical protein
LDAAAKASRGLSPFIETILEIGGLEIRDPLDPRLALRLRLRRYGHSTAGERAKRRGEGNPFHHFVGFRLERGRHAHRVCAGFLIGHRSTLYVRNAAGAPTGRGEKSQWFSRMPFFTDHLNHEPAVAVN